MFLVMVFPDVTNCCIFVLRIFTFKCPRVCAHVSTVDIYVTYSPQGHTSLKIEIKLVVSAGKSC